MKDIYEITLLNKIKLVEIYLYIFFKSIFLLLVFEAKGSIYQYLVYLGTKNDQPNDNVTY